MVLTHEVSIPFGLVLIAGAALVSLPRSPPRAQTNKQKSFATTQSVFALIVGAVSGVFIGYLGYLIKLSLEENTGDKFQSPTYSYCMSSVLVAMFNALLNGDRFLGDTSDVVSGFVAAVSVAATAFFVVKLSSSDVGTHAKRSKQW